MPWEQGFARTSINLVPRVLRLYGQRFVARRGSGELEFYYRRDFFGKTMQTVTGQPMKKINFFRILQSLLAPTRWQKSLRTLGTILNFDKNNCRSADERFRAVSSVGKLSFDWYKRVQHAILEGISVTVKAVFFKINSLNCLSNYSEQWCKSFDKGNK